MSSRAFRKHTYVGTIWVSRELHGAFRALPGISRALQWDLMDTTEGLPGTEGCPSGTELVSRALQGTYLILQRDLLPCSARTLRQAWSFSSTEEVKYPSGYIQYQGGILQYPSGSAHNTDREAPCMSRDTSQHITSRELRGASPAQQDDSGM